MTEIIRCQKCYERKPAAMLHAIFCKECSDALVEQANKPVDADLGDRLFAAMSARRVKQGWRP